MADVGQETPKFTCEKCGRTMTEKMFYTYLDGRKTELCKNCLTMHIDNFDPDTRKDGRPLHSC